MARSVGQSNGYVFLVPTVAGEGDRLFCADAIAPRRNYHMPIVGMKFKRFTVQNMEG